MVKCVVLANYWAADYKIQLFNSLFNRHKDFIVLYIAESEAIREWEVKRSDLQFANQIMFKGKIDDVGLFTVVARTWKRLNSLNPDVLIIGGYSYAACWAAFLWAKKNRKKVILWSASNEEDRDRFFLKERLKSFFVKRCDAANVYGQRNRDYLVKLGMTKDKIFIKGNCTDNTFYYEQTAKLGAKRQDLCREFGVPLHNFLYIGRFSREKNIFRLLKAYRMLNANDSWGLILVGNGPQMSEIENYIKNFAINNVLLPGFQQKEKIPKFLGVSDVLILPSISETWGLVVNEAMAAGLPVLVSNRCGCYPDIVKHGVNGFSFDPFDEAELLDCMKNIIENKKHLQNMGQASLDIIKDYTPERAARVVSEAIEYVSQR